MSKLVQIDNEIYHQGFSIIDNFLPDSSYHALRSNIEEIYQRNQFRRAKVGSLQTATLNDTIRKDKIYWLNTHSQDEAIQCYFAQIDAIAETLNRSFFLGLRDFEAHFAIYEPGDYYKLHTDQFIGTQDRRISCVYYLNQPWEATFGGELKIYSQEKVWLANILPQANRLICFDSSLPHEVCKTKHLRFSIAGWLKTRSLSSIL